MKSYIMDGNFEPLIDFGSQGRSFDLAIPTPEHFLPLLYTIALKKNDDVVTVFNDLPVGGALSMTSVMLG